MTTIITNTAQLTKVLLTPHKVQVIPNALWHGEPVVAIGKAHAVPRSIFEQAIKYSLIEIAVRTEHTVIYRAKRNNNA
jgi:hypothetical protein